MSRELMERINDLVPLSFLQSLQLAVPRRGREFPLEEEVRDAVVPFLRDPDKAEVRLFTQGGQ